MLRYNKALGPDEKIITTVIFSSGAYAVVYRGSRLRRARTWVFSCSNFAKENKRLLAVYVSYCAMTTNIFKTKTESWN